METSNIKNYAPRARVAFMDAVAKRLNTFGISANKKGELQVVEALVQGSVLQIEDNNFDSKLAPARQRLVQKSEQLGYAQLVEQVAYTWFNRLCAIRYMEIHGYLGHGFRVLSHPSGDARFEILDYAQDAAEELGLDRNHIIDLMLEGDKNEELYRELLLGQCHKLHEAMPFLFESLNDETELLLPDNLTRTDSILRGLVDSIPEEDWQQVEVIGWLYQFYISDKKDEVIGKVVKSEDIPAATQLFTPNWIVKYLVQNSVGRHWLQTYPDSPIKKEMEYYIEPAEQTDEVNEQLKAIIPESIDPESIKVLDPASGSGHIFIEAYNVLKAIYEERGYRSRDIPKLILENNIYGLDIDDRAAQLSGFSLMMMARQDDRRVFSREVKLNVLSLQETGHLDLPKLWQDLNLSGEFASGQVQDMFGGDLDLSSFEADNRYQLLQRNIERFKQAKTFGSLIEVPAKEHEALKELYESLRKLAEQGDSIQRAAVSEIIDVVHQALILSIRYDAVVANPPYMGSKGMNSELKEFAKNKFPDSKSDLFAMFIERGFLWLKIHGFNSMVTMQSWMFLSSYEKMRLKLLAQSTIHSMVHMGNGVMKIAFGTNATVFRNTHIKSYISSYSYVSNSDLNEIEIPFELPVKNDRLNNVISDDFAVIPGSPVAYWLSGKFRNIYENSRLLESIAHSLQGMITGDNNTFLRRWYEPKFKGLAIGFDNMDDVNKSLMYWVPYNKGGDLRKWYGNNEFVLNWSNQGRDLTRSRTQNSDYYLKPCVTWTFISSSFFAARHCPVGFVWDVAGSSAFPEDERWHNIILALMCSCLGKKLLDASNPTLNYQVENILALPLHNNLSVYESKISNIISNLVSLAKLDWDAYERSWDFQSFPLLSNVSEQAPTLESSYTTWISQNQETIVEMQRLEEENNRIFIEAYGLQDELTPEVPIQQITLTVNPAYRYGIKGTEQERSARFRSDTITELVSYTIGCTMGRYSLDQESLVYAHEGNEGFDSSLYKTFPADSDGIVPIMDDEWFKDDACNRVVEFVKAVWGEENLTENLQFIADSLCLDAIPPRKSETSVETIRRYLSTKFYKDHMQTYKNRPIYWLFSSGKEKAFECLVYLHRYNESTLSRMRTEYVTPLLGKYEAYAQQLEKQFDMAETTQDKKRFEKELKSINKKHSELREFDDKLKHYADMRISIDLDDGVKENYGKFGDLISDVKKITGKNPEMIDAN
ncbi:BREX-1 system adenine-specific DNA-methyltransferase PglX [Psychrobacter sanguinis]|uniref:BREX-1 system adenine-specific DNA-methyltransferase PglX n=1 Tax=Psychrobacter sanguinis TaxID=861445 RepID=UPI00191A6450|nr:BREX-1 system adenine-specific DNA-methyltransferase PglX [Psychrobacter sanguinis]UEC25528.1 BREX-1 system adenine-specific DNA-methyltransferase PglX [Psychrobacter sanguinis]